MRILQYLVNQNLECCRVENNRILAGDQTCIPAIEGGEIKRSRLSQSQSAISSERGREEEEKKNSHRSLSQGVSVVHGARQRGQPSIIVSHLWAAVPGPPSHSSFPPPSAVYNGQEAISWRLVPVEAPMLQERRTQKEHPARRQ